VDFDPSRLRRGEWLVGGGAVVLVVSLFVLPWYGSRNGWHGLETLRWLVLLTVLVALALVWFQATRRAPAIPVSFSAIVTVVGLLNLIALIYRVLINQPGSDDLASLEAGAYVGLVAAIAIVYGGYLSMREEGISERDAPGEIETVSLGPPTPGTSS
jgi:hypothetical protein